MKVNSEGLTPFSFSIARRVSHLMQIPVTQVLTVGKATSDDTPEKSAMLLGGQRMRHHHGLFVQEVGYIVNRCEPTRRKRRKYGPGE